MKINTEEIRQQISDILAEITDQEEIERCIILHLQTLNSNQRELWVELFHGLLRFKIFDTPQLRVNQFWDEQVLQMEKFIPTEFIEKCNEVYLSLDEDEETKFFFKLCWIDKLTALAAMAALRLQYE